ncbi:hypothetical protein CDL12_16837 [Handroanthus impetiginosus]|uniref:Bifunctional inhibitor/plant lipid transfer protein/seed storage helical domain-containing protein n=1 Tax=Handroanthus impetiginosus TaxID=429701 RepID=A0A2G9GZ54_9LAMI|nr:hypothetical protein CDL12_16837 [Handroanthus impetiginosus]
MELCTMNTKSSLFLALILILSPLTTADDSKDKEECADSLVGLATCLPYVGGTAKAPTPDCCNGLKQVLKTNERCLCLVIKDRNDPDLGLNINVTLALSLPDVCNAPANISQCPALLNLPPNSPDAQIFYQLGQKSNHTNAISPAGGPSANAGPTTLGSTSHQSSGGCGNRWLGMEILGGLVLLLWALIM